MASILDSSYQELEYITAGDGPYIQIAYNTGNITKLEFRAKFYANQNFAVFGNGPSSSSSYIGCRFFRSGSTTYCGHNTNRSELSVTYPTEFVNCSVEKTSLVVGSSSHTLAYNGSSTSNYISFFKTFGVQLKYGVYNNYGADKDKLKDLVMFYSSKHERYSISLIWRIIPLE